ncbi:MAG TPA: DUF3142 domain-containing protein [Pyrinomonadaceae bacterium]|nr:DUF3142 domain-containing protein [Pyrinomonadaceae bacterium]
MRFLVRKKLWLPAILVLVPISILALRPKPARTPTALSNVPPVIVWAWERPEKLDFIDPDQVGVAFLAKTLRLQGDRVIARPRLQPLELVPGTKLIAVVRIESDHPTLAQDQLQQTVHEVTRLSELPNISVVQIDFDATTSERDFYRSLLKQVRRDLPPAISLSITALASWCAGDQWLGDAPIDEAVPMLFRMGIDQRHFQSRPHFDAAICRSSAGVSTDELVTPPDVDRLYIFNPKPWSRDSLNSALEAYKK